MLKKVKVWLKKREIRKQDKISIEDKIRQLVERRDEVIKRATGTIPDFYLMRKDPMVFKDYLLWIIKPHIKRKFAKHTPMKNEDERLAQTVVYNILKEVEKEDVQKEGSSQINEEAA